ncbi:hypothetical protein GCM10020255_004820 [Rhodococcus baikonurensis]
MLTVDDHRILFTGDAGIPALSAAADQYEVAIGSFDAYLWRCCKHLTMAAAVISPRHCSTALWERRAHVWVSSSTYQLREGLAQAPSPKVVNALTRRGGYVVATEGTTVCVQNQASRAGWTTVPALPSLHEADD